MAPSGIPSRIKLSRALLRTFSASGVVLLTALFITSAAAGPTDPALAIQSATAQTGTQRVRVVVDGVFPGADLVQVLYPLQVIVRSLEPGGAYIRFDLGSGPFAGADDSLGFELAPSEALALLSQGDPEAQAEVLRIEADRLVLALPLSFPAGDAEVQFFVADGNDVLLSNAWPLSVTQALP